MHMLGVLKGASLRAEQMKAGDALDHHSSEKQDRGFSISWTTQFWIILFTVNNKLCWTLDNVRVNLLTHADRVCWRGMFDSEGN